MNYKGITAADSGKARLSGKIPERSEDDFSETARLGLAVRKRRTLILPGSSFGSVSHSIPFFITLPLYISFVLMPYLKRAAHADGPAVSAYCQFV